MQWWCAATGAAWSWRWTPYPGVWLFILTLAAGYALTVRHARAGGHGVPRAKLVSFSAGLVLLWVALDWPVGALGAGYLASVHMVQFLLIGLLAPVFLLMGVPIEAYRSLERRPRLLGALGVLTHPLVALATWVVLMAWTHWPAVVDTLMATQAGSFLLDLVWLVGGLVFWWPVVAPVPVRPWLGYPVKMGHLVAATIVNTGVFAFLAFSRLPVYEVYELAPPVSGLSSRDDQLLAGLLMKIGGAPILWTAISILFFRWYREQQRDDERPAAPALETATP